MLNDTDNSYFLSEVADKIELKSRYLFSSNSFLVFPSIGALVAGHVLIIPKHHITAMAFLDANQSLELEEVIEEIGVLLRKIYRKNIIAMEHGVIDENRASCVSHAHIHMLPIDVNLVELINKEKKKISLKQLLEFRERKDDYLLSTNDLKTYYLCDLGELPSQFLRKIIFDASNLTGSWNWKYDNRIELLKQTIDDIAAEINNLDIRESYKKLLQSTLLTSRGLR